MAGSNSLNSEDPNKKHYFSPLSEEEISPFAAVLSEELPDLILWKKGEEKGAETFALKSAEFDLSSFKIELRLSHKEGLLKKIRGSALKGQEVLGKCTLHPYTYFFASPLKYMGDELAYSLELGKPIYRCQQRANYRLSASRRIEISLKVRGKIYKANDISAGGINISVPKDELEFFEPLSLFHNAEVILRKKTYYIKEIRVMNIGVDSHWDGPQECHKVGMAFGELPYAQERQLALEINSEARAEELLKRFGHQ